ncbi:hypothetical protein ABW06_24700 [Pluralibacter gergoviae]|uniref:Uncharacterized protein n=1 Tax=Pluralibacter gergoviae TaxID=61647 RepID=A0A0J5KKB1_PLUGE|nr:hypothetical protein [Pluralibacter gergoviae]KMK08146.1 hypothetical protein ABW06_24700 [Pluralibacter gergoviae]
MKLTYEQLEQELAAARHQIEALVAENWNMRDTLRQLIAGRPGGCYFIKWEPLCFKALNESPDTDAAIAEIGARALDAHADDLRSKIGNPAFNDAAHSYAARRANEFAQQLRAEASK